MTEATKKIKLCSLFQWYQRRPPASFGPSAVSRRGAAYAAPPARSWWLLLDLAVFPGPLLTTLALGRDATTDLAVLRVSSVDLAPPVWAEPDLASVRVGHLVLAMERPGQRAQATLGIVSALGESWRTPTGRLLDRYVQTDVVMFPGFFGGPLIHFIATVMRRRAAVFDVCG